jgi:hypothetical protein
MHHNCSTDAIPVSVYGFLVALPTIRTVSFPNTYPSPLQIVVPATIHLHIHRSAASSNLQHTHSHSHRYKCTHCNPTKGVWTYAAAAAAGMMGETAVASMRSSWSAVLALLIWVGRTSAEGMEKSQ